MDLASPFRQRIDGVSSCDCATPGFWNWDLATKFSGSTDGTVARAPRADRPSSPGVGVAR